MNKIFHRIAALFLAMALCFGLGAQCFADDDTLYIYNEEDLLQLCQNCSYDAWSKGKTVVLMADISLGDQDFTPIPYFSGTFEGKGHAITGLNISGNYSPSGLFATLGKDAVIQDLNVSGMITPSETVSSIGGIAGVNKGSISNCSFSGTISGKAMVGGIAGENTASGIIRSCASSGNIYGKSMTGGIAGKNSGTVRSCSSTAYINTDKEDPSFSVQDFSIDNYSDLLSLDNPDTYNIATDTGGICGYNDGYLLSCTGNGVVGYQHIGYNVGGVVGRSCGHVSDCTNSGRVYGRKDVGGVVGLAEPYVILDLSQDSIENIRTQLHSLSSLIDKAASDAGSSSHKISSRLTTIGDSVEDVEDGVKDLGDELTDYVDSTVSEINRASEILGNTIEQFSTVTSLLPSISENLTSAMDSTQDAITELSSAGTNFTTGLKSLQVASDYMQSATTLLDTGMKDINSGVQTVSNAVYSIQNASDYTYILNPDSELWTSIGTGISSISAGMNVIVNGNAASGNQGVNKLLSESATDLRSALDSFTTASTYVNNSAPYISNAVSSLGSASSTLTEALKNLNSIVDYLKGVDPLTFGKLSDSTAQTSDDIYNSVKDVSSELELLNSDITDATDTLVNDIRSINTQVSIVTDLLLDELYGIENADTEDYISDTSDEDIDAVTNGKVLRCNNRGYVYGDLDVGGVAGSMQIYNSVDPENDLSTDSSLLNRHYELKCILQDCEGSGTVVSKKNYAGAICGLAEMGIITDCEGSGTVESESGGYVGGVVGSGGSIIRRCCARAALSGGDCIGGIIGGNSNDSESLSVTDSCSMITIDSDGQYLGAISGENSGTFSGNYFVSDELNGINGLSYEGCAEPLSYEELLEKEDTSALFYNFTLKFVVDDETIRSVSFHYGDSFDESVFPIIPSKDGYYSKWDMDSLTNLHFDTTVTAEYFKYITAIPSSAERSSNRPVFFVEGEFDDTDVFTANTIMQDFSTENMNVFQTIQSYNREILEQWHISFTDDGSETHTIRYLDPSTDADSIFIYQKVGDTWQRLNYETIGSYLCFDIDTTDADITIISSVTAWWLWAVLGALALCIVLTIALTLIITLRKIHKARRANDPELKEIIKKIRRRCRIVNLILILLLLGMAGTMAGIVLFAPQVKNDAEVYMHLRNYAQNADSTSQITIETDDFTTTLNLAGAECDGKTVHIVSWQGIPVYYCDGTMILENGDAYSVDASIPDTSDLLQLAANTFLTVDMTTEESASSKTYTVEASGDTAQNILAILLPDYTTETSPTIQISLITEHEEISSLIFTYDGDEHVTATVSILENKETELPEDVTQTIKDGSYQDAEPIPEELKQLLSAWLNLARLDPMAASADLHVDYNIHSVTKSFDITRTELDGNEVYRLVQGSTELYAMGNTICDKNGKSVSANLSSTADLKELVRKCYLICIDGELTSSQTDDEISYSLKLNAAEMEALAKTIAPDLDTDIAEFTSGYLSIIVKDNIISNIQISCSGSITVLSITNNLFVSADMNIKQGDHLDIPEKVQEVLLAEK